MLNLATSGQPLATSGVIDAPLAEVWKAWTTTEGITSWMVANGTIDLKVGGKMRSSYAKDADLSGPDVIENTIISYDPMRMLSIKCTQTPKNFPFKKAMENAWTIVYFEPEGEAKTKVLIRMLGYTHDQESVDMRLFFMRGNQQTLDALAAHFKKG